MEVAEDVGFPNNPSVDLDDKKSEKHRNKSLSFDFLVKKIR